MERLVLAKSGHSGQDFERQLLTLFQTSFESTICATRKLCGEATLDRIRSLGKLLALVLSGCAAAADGYPSVNPRIANQSLADGVPYFETLRWGMTEEQVTSLYPDIMREPETRISPPRIVPVLHHNVFADCRFAVTFRFFPVLAALSMELESGNSEDCRNRLYNDLMMRFGDRPKTYIGKSQRGGGPNEPILVQTGTVTYVQWFGKVTTIIYLQQDSFPTPQPASMSFQLSLNHTGAPGTFLQ